MLLSVFPLPLWDCTSAMPHISALFFATIAILCETGLVNRTIKSGLPILHSRLLSNCVKIFALHPYCLHMSLYWHAMRSCPPIITTLIHSPYNASLFGGVAKSQLPQSQEQPAHLPFFLSRYILMITSVTITSKTSPVIIVPPLFDKKVNILSSTIVISDGWLVRKKKFHSNHQSLFMTSFELPDGKA